MKTDTTQSITRSSTHSSLLLTLALIGLALGAGCGADRPTSASLPVRERLSAPPDADLFTIEKVMQESIVKSWVLSDPSAVETWHVEPASSQGAASRQGLVLHPTEQGQPPVSLTAVVDIHAEDVSIVEVTFKDVGYIAPWLYWAGPGQELAPQRRARVSETTRRGGKVRIVRFFVSEEPAWRGEIRSLRIIPAINAATDLSIVSIRLIRDAVIPEKVEAASARPWKVDLGHTIRNAVVAFPDRPWVTTVTVPEAGGALRFVPGIPADLKGPVRFDVSAIQDDGHRSPLVSRSYGEAPGFEAGWQEAVDVPLSSLTGRTVKLELKVGGVAGIRRSVGLPAWGSVQLATAATGSGRAARPDVVLIIVDTLRADHLSAYGYPRQTTPKLDAWAARRGVLFETVVAPSPWTLPSHISIFTGIDAVRHGANYHLPARAELDMMAERFAAAGYETMAWTGGGYLGSGYGLHQGFEAYSYWLDDKERELPDNVEQVVQWVSRDHERPYLLLLHTYEVHEPYFERQPYFDRFAAESGRPRIPSDWVATRQRPRRPRDGFLTRKVLRMSPDHGRTWESIPPGHEDSVIDRYDAGLAFTDAELGKVLEALETHQRSQRTLVALTSDHGEALGEHGLSGHAYLYDFNILVPLIIAAPGSGWPQGRRVSQQVRSVDIAPTLLELAGLKAPEGIDGMSLTPLVEDGDPGGGGDRPGWAYAASSNRGLTLRTPETKYVLNNTAWHPAFGDERLYDLASDPGEDTDLSAQRRDEADALRKVVSERLSRDAVGVWLHLQGPERGTLTVELRGNEIASPARLKAVSYPGDGVRYVDQSGSAAVATIPAGREALLFSETAADAQITVTARGAGQRSAQSWRLVVRELAASPWRMRLERGAWVAGDGDGVGAAITISTAGGFGEEASEATADDVRDQLRALGYVE